MKKETRSNVVHLVYISSTWNEKFVIEYEDTSDPLLSSYLICEMKLANKPNRREEYMSLMMEWAN